jgi:hypothetical protein
MFPQKQMIGICLHKAQETEVQKQKSIQTRTKKNRGNEKEQGE